jgi:hypothetical protein
MGQRRVLQGCGMAVLGLALACAPMAAASATTHKTTHHPKPKSKHHAPKTVAKSKGALSPGSSLCLQVESADSSSADVGSAVEKAMEQAITSGNFAAAKQAMIAALAPSLKEEGAAESALKSAPANVQAAMKGLFGFVTSYETAIQNASSFTGLATSMETLVQSSPVEADALTVANYVTAQCGPTTTSPT